MNAPRLLASVLVAALLVVGAVVGAFAVLDFGAMESETTAEGSHVAEYVNDSHARFEEGVYLHVRGEGPRERVAARLVAAFEARDVPVIAVDTLDRQYDGNVLVVTLGERTGSYTPVGASDVASWTYFYTTTGNTSSVDDPDRVVVIRDGDDTSRIYYQTGEFTLSDRTTGLFSAPAYERHVLSAQAGAAVTEILGASVPAPVPSA